MKLISLILITLCSNFVFANIDIHQYSVEEVFVVPSGYDTNDNIEITFISKLPNSCFSPYESKIERESQNVFKLNFFIKRKNISSCETINSNLFKNPIYYTQTISLGELSAGKYKIYFQKNKTHLSKEFLIKGTQNQTMDDFIYAPVTNVFIPELIYSSTDAQVIMSGIIQSNCLSVFDQDIEVQRQGNIFIIIPKAKISEYFDCTKIKRPLQKIVSLGEIKESGIYLIHVRSQSGLSVNKVFQVKNKEIDISGREI